MTLNFNNVDDTELEKLLAGSPAPRVTKESMTSRITNVEYHRIGETVTICSITLNNGYSVRGESACVDPKNYNQKIGERISYDNAFQKLWTLFGFLLAEHLYSEKK